MGVDPRSTELGHDQLAVRDDSGQTRGFHPPEKLISSKAALAGGAPDVDPLGVEHQDPGIDARQLRAERVETQLVVGRHQDG
jgi:hypothetical protein